MTDYRGDEPMEEFGGGDGSSALSAFVIATPGQLKKLIIESRKNSFRGKYILLATDFRITADNWEPIGSTLAHSFNGTFNGQGHTIQGELKNSSEQKLFGFFGYLKDATITNLHMDATIENIANNTVYCYTGSIAGYSNRSTISECSNSGKIIAEMTGSIYTGGIAGISYNRSTIIRCTNMGEVNGESSQNTYIGGIAGDNTTNSLIVDCINQGVVNAISSGFEINNEVYVGGISGRNSQNSDLTHCVNEALVNGNGKDTISCVGGISGQSTHYCTTQECCNRASEIKANGRITYLGGIVGNNDTGSIIDLCENQGKITGQGNFCSYVGGIVGFNLSSQIYDCCKNSGYINEKEPSTNNNYLLTGGNLSVITPCPKGHENIQ